MPNEPLFVPLAFERLSEDAQRARSWTFLDEMSRRRSVRSFSSEPVSYELVKESVWIAVGLLLASLHEAGLATFTHRDRLAFCGRSPVDRRTSVRGPYPAPGCTVPDLVPSRPTRSSSCAYLVYVWTVGSGSRRSSRSSKSRRMLSPLESTAS